MSSERTHRVVFKRAGKYAHKDIRTPHLEVKEGELEQEVNDDMMEQCREYEWAEPAGRRVFGHRRPDKADDADDADDDPKGEESKPGILDKLLGKDGDPLE
jgi:hypothetical protein